MHGLPFLFLLAELFCFSDSFQVQRIPHFTTSAWAGVAYVCWANICAFFDGEWVKEKTHVALDSVLRVFLSLMQTSSFN